MGYEQPFDRADPRRANDYQTAILYNASALALLESDHTWLSATPRAPGSRSWGSVGARTATIGAFRVLDAVERT